MNLRKSLLLAVVAATLPPITELQAARIEGLAQYGPIADNLINYQLLIPKFDASLGTLFAVNLQFEAGVRNSYSPGNPAGSTVQITWDPVLEITSAGNCSGPSICYTFHQEVTVVPSLLSTDDVVLDLQPGSSSATLSTALEMAPYIGRG